MNPRARHQGLVVEPLEDEVLIYDRRTHHAHHLNRVVMEVWRACDGTRSEAQLVESVSAALGKPFDREQLELALHQLELTGLLERVEEVERASGETRRNARPRSLSRRKLLKGLAVAVPVVTTILAPTMADAASLCPSAVPCTPATKGLACLDPIRQRCGKCRTGSVCR